MALVRLTFRQRLTYKLMVVWPGAWIELVSCLLQIATLGWWSPSWYFRWMGFAAMFWLKHIRGEVLYD